jgi:glycosyltransferase involved in cell wall biosynthesis
MRHWQAQIFLSKREGLGNVILEAGACGIPTFCWNTLGTIDAIPDFTKFFLVDIYNDSVLIQRIEKYLKQPFNNAEKQEYSNWFITNFNQELVLESFYSYIKALK